MHCTHYPFMYANAAQLIFINPESALDKKKKKKKKKKKNTIHQQTTMLSTSKIVLFPGLNYLLTTGADDSSLAGNWVIIKVSGHRTSG